MKRIFNLTLLLLFMVSMATTAFGFFGKKDKTVVLKLADNHAEDYPTVMGDKYFAELVEERTEGRVRVEVYHSGQLGDEKTTIEQVQFGAIDMVRTSISPLTQYNDKLNVLMLPYLYRSREHMFDVLDGSIGEEFLLSLEANNLVGLCWFDSGARNFYNTKREVKSVADMKGLKIRVQGSELMMGLVEALGASATPMAFGEVYSALQTGVIDGAENNWPSYDSTSHYEAAGYFTVDEHTRVPEMILINKRKLASISAEDQEIIKQAARDAAVKQREFWQDRVEVSKDKIAANGNTVTELTPEARQGFQDAVMPLYEKFASQYMDLVNEIIAVK